MERAKAESCKQSDGWDGVVLVCTFAATGRLTGKRLEVGDVLEVVRDG